MSSLVLRRWPTRELALMAGLAVWVAVVAAIQLDLVERSPEHHAIEVLLTYGVPAGLVLAAWLRRAQAGVLPMLAGTACFVVLALMIPGQLAAHPKIAYAVPGAVIAGIITQRFPSSALIALVALSGFYGSVEAFFHVAGDRSAVWVLEGLWAGILLRLLVGERDSAVRVTPVMFLLVGYLILAVLAAVTTEPGSSGFRALRIAPQYLSVALLIGYGGFSARHLKTFGQGLLVVCFLVDAYASLRWVVGPAAAETALQKNYQDVIYNRLAYTNDAKVQGSFPNGNSLGLWLTCTTPFVLAAALSLRGRFRLLAMATLPLAAIALFGSAQRTAAASLAAGLLVVVMVHAVSRGQRGPRLGVLAAAILAVIVSATAVYPAVVNNPEKRKRYSNLLTPSQDLSFQERLQKWRQTLVAIDEEPFGHGLGAGNPLAVGGFRFADISSVAIDNAYLVIGYEQGLFAMGFFILTMFVLLAELLRFAVWTRGPSLSLMSTAAVGTLVAMLIELISANYTSFPAIMAGWAIVGLGLAAFSLPDDSPAVAGQAP